MPRKTATIVAVLLLLPAAVCLPGTGPAAASAAQECMVSRVVDGDTFQCLEGSKVRLIGIDAPERDQGDAGRRAGAALRRLLPEGSRVTLESGVDPRDRYGRRLAYVWRGPAMVNEAMLLEGWAVVLTIPPNIRYVARFEAAEHAARRAGRGLWATHGFDCLPAAHRRGRC